MWRERKRTTAFLRLPCRSIALAPSGRSGRRGRRRRRRRGLRPRRSRRGRNKSRLSRCRSRSSGVLVLEGVHRQRPVLVRLGECHPSSLTASRQIDPATTASIRYIGSQMLKPNLKLPGTIYPPQHTHTHSSQNSKQFSLHDPPILTTQSQCPNNNNNNRRAKRTARRSKPNPEPQNPSRNP